ncbi:MAG: hypothetical protein JSS95_07350 [Acidobacteria bacterium]|nr:hypothetical protein [Acidobacteriota bacterium]
MAPDFDDSPTMDWTNVSGAESFWDISGEDMNVGLTVMMSCVNTLFKARDDGRVVFAAGVTAKMLEIMGFLLTRASRVKGKRREEMFHHWLQEGEYMLDDVIKKAAARKGKLLMPDDLTAFMEKPPGYEV